MNKATIYERAAEILEGINVEASYRPDYSGRGMGGETTPAIVTENGVMLGWAVTAAILENADDDPESIRSAEVFNLLPKRRDAMGMSTIWY